jgi:glycosyltransferase involved in cell wall biosynthesis
MKIGFDAKRLFQNFTGLGNYSRTLVSSLNELAADADIYLFTPKKKYHSDTRDFFKEPYHVITPKTQLKAIWRTFTCTKAIKNLHLDIFHGLSHELPIGIKKTGVKSLVTMHDLVYKTFPNDFTFIDRLIYDFKFRYACKNADKIVAISKSTKNDLIKYYQTPPEKIEVIYQSCHKQFKTLQSPEQINSVLENYGLPDNFLLFVGSVIERKNVLTLIKAIEKLGNNIDIPLVVVGNGKAYLQEVKKYVHTHNLQSRVYFIQKIAFEHLPALYQKASVFIYPSVYEGFGIPVIEALWSQTPVITSNISSMPEAAGAGAFLCNPASHESIAQGIDKILNDSEYAHSLVEKGLEHIKNFENEKLVKQMIRLYKNLLA